MLELKFLHFLLHYSGSWIICHQFYYFCDAHVGFKLEGALWIPVWIKQTLHCVYTHNTQAIFSRNRKDNTSETGFCLSVDAYDLSSLISLSQYIQENIVIYF